MNRLSSLIDDYWKLISNRLLWPNLKPLQTNCFVVTCSSSCVINFPIVFHNTSEEPTQQQSYWKAVEHNISDKNLKRRTKEQMAL